MSVTLKIDKTLAADHTTVTIQVTETTGISPKIFIHLNTGTDLLGIFQGVCNVDELSRIQVYVPGATIPIFGNKFLRHSTMTVNIPLADDPALVIERTVNGVKLLSSAYAKVQASTEIRVIP